MLDAVHSMDPTTFESTDDSHLWPGILLDLLGPDPGEPVCEAIRSDNEQKVQESSLNLKGGWTINPKKEAIKQGKLKYLKLLLERDNTLSESLVYFACEQKDMDAIRLLLDFGWNINAPIYSAGSLLCTAIHDEKFMEELVKLGADINAKSKLDEPVLSLAIRSGKIEVVHFLLAQGADITHGNLLHYAAERKDTAEGAELTRDLAQKGADVNAHQHDNEVARVWRVGFSLPTPLHVACSKQNVPVAQALLEHGADPQRQMLEFGRLVPPTALERARESNNQELLEILSKAATLGKEIGTPDQMTPEVEADVD